jgi:LacI family transcriptional regulator
VKRLTIRDVAERARVSVGTVSNALNRPDLVADDTLARIKSAIDEIGFVRNAQARQLRGVRSPAIGLVVLDIDNPFFTEVARGVEAAVSEIDHLVILCSSAGDRLREGKQLRLLEEQRVAGVLITPAGRRASKLQQQLRDRGTPVVLLDRRSPHRGHCSVAVDDVRGGQLAASHLVGLGHTRIGLINGPREISQCADRRAGFISALERASLKLVASNDIEMEALTIGAGQLAARQLLARQKPPTAVFCGNDLMALGVERAVIAAGLRIPDDIAIVGYDDVAFAQLAFVPLTSVRQPAYDLGYRAAELLLEEALGEQHAHQQVLFTPELVARASTLGDAVPASVSPHHADGSARS